MEFLANVDHWFTDDRFTANLIAAHGVIVVLVLAALVLRRLLTHGHNRLQQWGGLAKLTEVSGHAVRHGHTLLFLLTVAGVAVTLGTAVVYHLAGGDIRADMGDWFLRFTIEDLVRVGLGAGGLAAAIIITVVTVRALRRMLPYLRAHGKNWVGHKNNEQALERWFSLLERFGVAAIRLTGLWAAGQAVGLGHLADAVVGFVLRLVTTLAVARLLTLGCRALTHAAVDHGNRRFVNTTWQRYWERITGLFPFGDRCFEAAVYVSAAWLVVRLLHFTIPALAETHLGPRIVACIGIFFCTRVLIELLQVLLHEAFGMYAEQRTVNQKGRTLVPLLHSIGQYVLYFGSAVAMLGALGVNTAPILAGAGILGLAVGLGAQTLVTDLVSGFFMLFENQFLVGDYIQIADAHGVVEAVGMRTTQIRDGNGKLHILPNGQIKAVVSYSKGYVNAVVDYKVSAGSDLEGVFRAMKEAGEQLRQARKEVLAATEIHGIVDLGASDMTVRAVTRVRPGTHGIMQSEYRRLLKLVLDQQRLGQQKPALAA
jgi:small conductance mechanosensitive channel